jgi:hypothetical protein
MLKGHLRLACILLAALTAASTFGQTVSSSILGTLADQGNALIPNAALTLTEKATGAVQAGRSNEAGLFRFLDLKAGDYSLRVQASGFKAYDIGGIALASSETRDLGMLVLQLGALTEQVSVTAQATPVQTASSERSALVDATQLNEIALKGRDLYGYMRLLPGVVDSAASRDLSNAFAVQNIGINGQSSSKKNVTFDGITILDAGGQNDTFVAPNLDAIGEVRVLTNGFQAEFGRQAGGAINIITKNGTREFHGSGYWNRRHEDMNANTFFNNRQGIQRPLYRYFVGGYSIGGPIYIPKVFNTQRQRFFFFASQEFTRVKVPTATATANMPTGAERSGDFSNSVNSTGKLIPIIDPTTGVQFPGNIVPKNRIDPTGQAILNLFPQPNGYVNPAPGQQFSANFLGSDSSGYHNHRDDIVRLDTLLNKNMNLYLRVGRDIDNALTPFTIGPGFGGQINFVPGYAFTAHLSHTLSPSMVNEVVFGLGHNNYGFYHAQPDSTYFRTNSLNPPSLRSAALNYCTEPGNQSCFDSYKPYLPTFTFAGGSLAGPVSFFPNTTGNDEIPYQNFNDNYTLQDNFSKVIGNHNIKAGVYVEYESKVEPNAGYQYAGVYNFGSTVNNPLDTGHGYANALLGIFQSYSESSNIKSPNVYYWIDEGYVQDNWRVSRRFTFDLGVRWYHQGAMHENYGAFADFFPQLWNPAQAPRIYWPATVGGKAVALDRVTGATAFAALAGTLVPGVGNPVDGMHVDGLKGDGNFFSLPYVSLAPRIGFAWDVFGNGKMAVRASFGVFNNLLNLAGQAGESGAPPVVYTPVVFYSSINQVPQAAASAAISPTGASVNFGNQKVESSDQFNFTIQRDIGFNTVVDFAYVMNNDRHARQSLQINPIPLLAYANPANIYNNTEVNANLLRTAYPGMGSITQTSNSLSSLNYNALQVQVQHRLSRGLQFGAAYTFSKALGTQGLDNYHSQRQWFYGPLASDRTHILAINYTYALPGVGSRLGPAKHVFSHWNFSGVTIFQTGAPVTPACSSLSPGPANSDPSLSGGGARCQVVADPNDYQHTFFTNFNTGAFTVAPPGTFGNIGLNTLRQPAWVNWDMALDKRIQVGKDTRRVLRLRIEAYNIFNHTEFSTIGTTLTLLGAVNTNTQYGQYTATLSPRQMSTTLRFEF